MKKWQITAIVGSAAVILVVALTAILLLKGSTAAATVNGVAIPRSDVERELANYKRQQPAVFSGPNGKEQEKRVRAAALEMLIDAELTRQEAGKAGVKVSEKAIRERLAALKKRFPDPGQFQEALKEQGLSEEGLRGWVQNQLLAEKMLLRISGPEVVKDKDVREFYEKNKSQMIDPETKGPKSFDEVRGQIKQYLSRQKAAAWLAAVKKKAKIVKAAENPRDLN